MSALRIMQGAACRGALHSNAQYACRVWEAAQCGPAARPARPLVGDGVGSDSYSGGDYDSDADADGAAGD